MWEDKGTATAASPPAGRPAAARGDGRVTGSAGLVGARNSIVTAGSNDRPSGSGRWAGHVGWLRGALPHYPFGHSQSEVGIGLLLECW